MSAATVSAASVSNETPILDLQAPLEPPQRFSAKRLLGTIACAILSIALVLFIVIVCVARWPDIFDYLSANFGALSPSLGLTHLGLIEYMGGLIVDLLAIILVHEVGHLLFGRAVGWKFLGMQVGPFLITSSSGKLRIFLRRAASLDGFALMKISSLTRLSRRLLIFILGGPIATGLGVLAGYLWLRINPVDSKLLFGWIQLFVYLSVLILFVNLLPFQARSGLFTDGARIKMLKFPSAKTLRLLAGVGLGLQAKSGKRAREFNRRWISVATQLKDGSRDELVGLWYAYFSANDAEDTRLAASLLERCLSLKSARHPGMFRDLLCLEASVFQAWFCADEQKCAEWRKRVLDWKVIPWFIVIRADTAWLWAQTNTSAAIEKCQEALSKIDALPSEINRDLYRTGWTEWLEKIQQRSIIQRSSTRDIM